MIALFPTAEDVSESVFQPNLSDSHPQTVEADDPVRSGSPMYGDFYELREAPFDLTPNSRFLFLSPRQAEALSNLRYALASSKGFTLITGEAGTGKTTLARAALAELGDTPNRYALVSNPTLGRSEFYEVLARTFELSEEARTSKAQFLFELQRDVEARFAAGGLTGLIVDEAQSMPHELLEEIRLLGNIETTTTKLLNIIMIGQPELADRLNETSLRQLKQRIALRCELKPLVLRETAAYISGRLRIAGGSPEKTFTREAVIRIHEASAGIPRSINVLCDNSMISGFAAGVKPISVEIVESVCRDFDMGSGSTVDNVQDKTPTDDGNERSLFLAPSAGASEKRVETPRGGAPAATVNPVRKRRFVFF